jgi:hypothetical protein
MKTISRSLLAVLFASVAGITLISTGCSSNSAVGVQQTDEHDGEPHLEHIVPAHKPADLESMVQQLTERTQRLSQSPSDESPEDRTKELQELTDIVNWIPELAADSELRKADFDDAVSISKELLVLVNKQFGSGDSRTTDAAVFDPLIERLRALSSRAELQQ